MSLADEKKADFAKDVQTIEVLKQNAKLATDKEARMTLLEVRRAPSPHM